MGGTPLFALNIVGFPIHDLPKTILTAILQGGADKAAEAGVSIVGGHSIDDKEPKYGLVVTGEVKENHLITNAGAKPGDVLVLTKPLGTGIISTAIKKGFDSEESLKAATESMTTLNAEAAKLMKKYSANAATDITGFGLLGHLGEMCKSSGVSATIHFDSLPFLPGVESLAQRKLIPGGSKRNLDHANHFVSFSKHVNKTQKYMASDAQTSGGLLISMNESLAADFCSEFSSSCNIIGSVNEQNSSLIQLD